MGLHLIDMNEDCAEVIFTKYLWRPLYMWVWKPYLWVANIITHITVVFPAFLFLLLCSMSGSEFEED